MPHKHSLAKLPLLRVATLLAVALPAAAQAAPRYLTDALGRDIVLHGLNVSNAAKSDPLGVGWHREADYARMRAWGFNVVRLLVFWSHLEPQAGRIDRVYLDRVAQRVGWARKYGLRVILDMHQDLYGKRFGSDGAPVWATRDGGLPYRPISPWWLNYLQPPVRAAFSHLFRDADLQRHYGQAWAALAARLGKDPAVIGYDLMNEPFFGNEPFFEFSARRLAPFYQAAAAAIRAADRDARVFFEPMAFPTASGLPALLPPQHDPNAVYAPHYYDPFVHEGIGYFGNAVLVDLFMRIKAGEAALHGVPFLLGEFGAAPTTPRFDVYLDDLLAALDRHAAGWTFWSYDRGGGFSILDRSGKERANLKPLLRAYPRAVAGRIDSFGYEPKTRELRLRYTNRRGVRGPTEIWVPARRVYGGRFEVLCTDPTGAWSWYFDAAREVVVLRHDPTVRVHEVRIVP